MASLLLMLIVCAGMPWLAGCQASRPDAKETLATEVAARRSAQTQAQDLYEKGLRQYGDGELDAAARLLEQAVNADRQHAAAWLTLGVVEQERRRFTEAARAYHQAAHLSRSRYEPYYNLGTLYESVGYYDRAIEAYESALDLAPNNLHVMENLARAYIRAERDLPRAQRLIAQALEREFRPQWRQWLQLQALRLSERLDPPSALTEAFP